MAKIEIENVSKEFSGHRALDNITLEIPENGIFGLLGPNGAGKTTLIRIINQIIAPDSGSIKLNGQPLTRRDTQHFGYLPEERGLYKKMRVDEQLLFLARLKGVEKNVAKQRIAQQLRKFALEKWADKPVEQLSKGMQQKVQFISTILHKPQFLILDEPFSGFDPINTNLLKQEILELQQEGTTIMLSTHNMSSAEELCSNFALINRSHLIAQGIIDEYKLRHKEGLFRLILTDANPVEADSMLTITAQKETFRGRELHIRKNESVTNTELITRLNTQHQIAVFEELLPSMNDIFITLVNQYDNTKTAQSHE